MTEIIPSNTIATQTPLPRTYLSFASLATKSKAPPLNYRTSPFERQMLESELMLQTQQNALRMIDIKINEQFLRERQPNEANTLFKEYSGSAPYEQTTPRDAQQDENSQSILSSGPDSSIQQDDSDKVAMAMVVTNARLRHNFLVFFIQSKSCFSFL